jgi:hypothetical protein
MDRIKETLMSADRDWVLSATLILQWSTDV